MVTTRAVVLEIGNALAELRYRQEAVRLLSSIEQDPNVEIVPVSEDLYARAWQLYREREDKVGADRLPLLCSHAGARDPGGTHTR